MILPMNLSPMHRRGPPPNVHTRSRSNWLLQKRDKTQAANNELMDEILPQTVTLSRVFS